MKILNPLEHLLEVYETMALRVLALLRETYPKLALGKGTFLEKNLKFIEKIDLTDLEIRY
jgi:hypothetical protein